MTVGETDENNFFIHPIHPVPSHPIRLPINGGRTFEFQTGRKARPPPSSHSTAHLPTLTSTSFLTRFATGFVATDLPLVAKHLASNWVVLVVAKSVANLSDSRFSSTCHFWRRVFLRAPPGGWIFLLGGMLRVMLAKLGGCRDSAVRCEIFSSGNDDGT